MVAIVTTVVELSVGGDVPSDPQNLTIISAAAIYQFLLISDVNSIWEAQPSRRTVEYTGNLEVALESKRWAGRQRVMVLRRTRLQLAMALRD